MTERSATHSTFTIERSYPVQPDRVFAAFADGDAKAVWMDDPDFKSDGETEYEMDFRVGGHERFDGIAPDGKPYSYDGLFYDIVPDQRIVYSYEMYMGRERMSVSVTTVELAPEPGDPFLQVRHHVRDLVRRAAGQRGERRVGAVAVAGHVRPPANQPGPPHGSAPR